MRVLEEVNLVQFQHIFLPTTEIIPLQWVVVADMGLKALLLGGAGPARPADMADNRSGLLQKFRVVDEAGH